MKLTTLLLSTLVSASTALAANVTVTNYTPVDALECAGQKTHGTANLWTCQLDGSMAGLKIGVGVGAKIIGGSSELTCDGYNRDGERIACYTQKVDLGLVGIGKALGLSLVKNISLHSAHFDTIGNPKKLVGQTYGFGGSVDLTTLVVGAGAQANVTVNNRSGLGFEVGFSHGKEYGLHAGVHVQGFTTKKHDPSASLPCGGEEPMPDGDCPTGSGDNPFGM